MDWFLALRCAKLNALTAVKPNLKEHEVEVEIFFLKTIIVHAQISL